MSGLTTRRVDAAEGLETAYVVARAETVPFGAGTFDSAGIDSGPEPAHQVMPRLHRVASLLKRWLIGSHQGGIQRQHLDDDPDEFTFRFNRRRLQVRGLLFHGLAGPAVAIDRCRTD